MCVRKIKFNSFEEALKEKTNGNRHIYKCEICGKIHIKEIKNVRNSKLSKQFSRS